MFSRIFIERPRFAAVISVVMVLAGIIFCTKLPVAEYPEIAPPTLYVSATYSGASSDVVATTVAMVLEDAINSVDGLLYYNSDSTNNGTYSCQVTFESGTDTDMAQVNLQNAVKRAEAKLPEDVKKIGISVEKRGGDILAMFAFTTNGKSMNLLQLNNYVNTNIKDSIARIKGVSSATVMASQEYSMRIWLNPLRMGGLNISTADIIAAVQSQNIQAAAGAIGSENSNEYVNYKLNVQGRLKTPEEFKDIIIRTDPDGSAVRLGDVADVEISSSSYSGESYMDGDEVIGLGVYRDPDANALETVKLVRAELEKWKKRFPAGVNYKVAYDPTEFIEVSLKEIISTIVIALLLVVLITWIFLQDWRATLIPSIAIPVALMGTFPFMFALGYSINVLTMFGLILVIGSLCDDAIVVVENTQALMEREDLSPKEAATKCMEQITGAIIATTLVTVACYAPLAFYGGMVGEIYMQFAVTMCIALCLSTFVAMTLSPALCAILLKKPDGKVPLYFKPFNAALDFTRKIYLAMVAFLAKNGILTLLLLAAASYGVYYLFSTIDSSFLPDEDKGVVMCNIELPPDASLARTDQVIRTVYDAAKTIPGVKSVMLVSGQSMLSGTGENTAMCVLQLDHWDERKSPEKHIDNIIAELMKRTALIPDAKITAFKPPAIMGLGSTGGITFQLCALGDTTPQALSDTAKKLSADLTAAPETLYAMTSYNADTPQLYIDIDRDKAMLRGVSVNMINNTLQSKFAALYVNDFTYDGQNFKDQIQAGKDFRKTINDIEETQFKNNDGDMVPFTALGKIKVIVGPKQISRFNKMSSAGMTAQTAPGVSSQQLFRKIESMKLPANYLIEYTGMSYQEKKNEGQIVTLMALALLFAYLFLVAQYESWTIPVPVMLSVIIATLGALLGLAVMKQTMSIYAQLGMVMLIGLAAKNAILMVEFSKQEREDGKSIFDAAMSGANLRYRAVLMTAYSFLFGVFPLVIADGAGSGSRRAIGLTTFSGMLLATLVGIVFTPALYAVFQRIREWLKAKIPFLDRAAQLR